MILKKIRELKNSITETDQLIDKLISNLNINEIKVDESEKKIFKLKEKVRNNIEKIDEIIEDYNANS